jgi:hypothetical protein
MAEANSLVFSATADAASWVVSTTEEAISCALSISEEDWEASNADWPVIVPPEGFLVMLIGSVI